MIKPLNYNINKISFKGNTEFNVLYFNDIHAKTRNLKYFKTAVDEFDKENKEKTTLKFFGGDLNNGNDVNLNTFVIKVMNLIGLDASCIGNHDLEGGNYWVKAIKKAKAKFKFLSANLDFTRANKMEKTLAKSAVIKRNGEKVGVIGISAIDSKDLIFQSDFNNYFEVQNFNKTVKSVKEEVRKLEAKGINKIFLLAHTGEKAKDGFDYYQNLAKIGGIDVILGGHDHVQVDKWHLSERNEPVKVVSTGKISELGIKGDDLDSFGVLKTVFDDNGVLEPEKCNNKIEQTQAYEPSKEIEKLEEKYLQNKKIIAHINQDLECKNRKTEENPVADLLADSMLWIANKVSPQSNVQIALINSGEISADILKGDVSIRNVKEAFPFTENVTMVETKLTKKQLIDALNHGVQTTTFPKMTLGLLQVGGLKYTVGADNKVKDVCLIDKDGNIKERLDDMPENKEFTVVYDTYLMNGAGGMDMLKKDKNSNEVKIYPYNHQSGVIEYLKSLKKPVDIKTGRIVLEKSSTNLNNLEIKTV